MTTRFADLNGHRLRYRLRGEGPLAVFGHGLMGSIEQVDADAALLERLERKLRLLLYDARGHGESTGPEHPDLYTWETLGQDMAAWLEHTGDEHGIFGGASMGAASALWVALERPEAVRALVLVMPPPLGPDTVREPAERQAVQVLEVLATAIETFGLEKTVEFARQYPGFAATPEDADERARWLAAQNPQYLVHVIRGLMRAGIHDPSAYRRLTVPTLVLAHEGDSLHPVRAAKLVKEMAPHAVLRVAPDPGYWRNHPEEFVAEIESFLSDAI